MKALPLFHDLLDRGLISGHQPISINESAGTVSVRMPYVACDDCNTQLVTHWFATDLDADRPRLLCLWHAQDEEFHHPGTVQPLIEDQASWLVDARCRCVSGPWDFIDAPIHQ